MLKRLLIIYIYSLAFCQISLAAIPEEIKTILQKELPGVKFRLDDMATVNKDLWILIKPKSQEPLANGETLSLKKKTITKDFLFSNNWIFTPVKNDTIKSLDYFPEEFQEILLAGEINQGFLIPKNFVLPRDLAILAGRLPVKLASVELATEREVIYQERMKDLEDTKVVEFLSYSFNDGSFNYIEIDKNKESSTEISSPAIERIENLTEAFSFVTSLKTIDDEIYASEFPSSKIFKLNKLNANSQFDATKPHLQVANGDDAQSFLIDYQEVFDLSNIEAGHRIKDFIFNQNKSVLYILTAPKSNLYVVNYETKSLIKKIELPPMINSLRLLSRSSSEPDQLVFVSRAAAKIYIFSTFDYRISQEIEMSKQDEHKSFIVHDAVVNNSFILVAVESTDMDVKRLYNTIGEILYFDVISGKKFKDLELSFIPRKLKFSNDKDHVFALGVNKQNESYAAKVDLKFLQHEELNLSPDLSFTDAMLLAANDQFLVIPSSSTNIIGLVDVATWSLVKKFNVKEPISLLLNLGN